MIIICIIHLYFHLQFYRSYFYISYERKNKCKLMVWCYPKLPCFYVFIIPPSLSFLCFPFQIYHLLCALMCPHFSLSLHMLFSLSFFHFLCLSPGYLVGLFINSKIWTSSDNFAVSLTDIHENALVHDHRSGHASL